MKPPRFAGRSARVLDFDTEARPLSWYGGDFVTKEVTCIAWKFIGERGKPTVFALGECEPTEMLTAFAEAYAEADVVTGHFIRAYDLPVVNGALMEFGLPGLGPKLAHDTKLDLDRASGLSKSQENLGAMLGLKHPKVGMDQAMWRAANRLTPAGIALTKKRCVGDVLQHIELRDALLHRGLLAAPRLWTPRAGQASKYHG